jgi:hypothetical protein
LGDKVLEQQVVVSVGGGKTNEAGQGARHRDDAEDLGAGALPFAAEQQSETESLVENARKRMGWIDGDGGEKRVDFALKVALCKGARFFVQFVPLEQADTLFAQLWQQVLIPAAVLGVNEAVNFDGELGERFVGAQAVVTWLAVAVFNALHEAGLADLDVLIEVGAGDGEELDALEHRIGRIFGFFQDAAIELHPGEVPAVEQFLFLCRAGHGVRPVRCVGKSKAFSREWSHGQ